MIPIRDVIDPHAQYFLVNDKLLLTIMTTSCTVLLLHAMRYTGLFEMIVGVLTTCHTQHT